MISALAALTTLVSTLALLAILRPLATYLRLTDQPGGRKDHVGEIPLVGGIAMFLGMVAGMSVVAGTEPSTWYLLLAGTLLVIAGALDDRQGLHYVIRLAAQVAATLIMVFGAGLIIADLGSPFGMGIIHLGPVAVVGTLLVTMTVINGFNFIDGVDGLAGSIALVALCAVALAGGAAATTPLALVAMAAIIGFLVFNFPHDGENRLRTFMGDAGSTLLGLVVVWLTIAISQGDARQISPVVGLWFALVPIADFLTCFVRRIAQGRSPFSAGRDHFHHLLLLAGLTARQVVGLLTGAATVYAGIGLLGAAIGAPDWLMFSVWITLLVTQYRIVRRAAAWFEERRPLQPAAPVAPQSIPQKRAA